MVIKVADCSSLGWMRCQSCNSSLLVPKANGKVWLCLDPARLNKVLIRPIHRGPTLNDILLRLAGVKYLTLINAYLGYDNLHLDEQSSYLTIFSCLFGRYRYIWLPFGVMQGDGMFQEKIDSSLMRCPTYSGQRSWCNIRQDTQNMQTGQLGAQ